MAQMTMYPVKDGSPQTTTSATLSDSATEVSVTELACFPAVGTEGANLITFWDDTTYETCEYTAKSSASGTGTLTVVRSGARHSSTSGGGIEWPSGTKCARTGTGYDFTAYKNNIEDLDTRLDTAEGEIDALQTAPPAHKTIHQSGGTDAIKLDDLSAPDDNTDLNVSASAHGLCPKLPDDASKFLDGSGNWAAPPVRDNLIINGDFSVAQRGTSFTSATWRANNDDSYLLDRWLLLSDGNDIVDVTQIASPFSRSRYALQAEVETANKRFGFCQIIEANTCIPLRGQKISVSFAAKTVSAKLINNVRVAVLEWTGTADTVTSDVVSDWASNLTFATNWAALNTPANLALTTSEQTFKVENLTVGTSCNNLAVFVWVDDTDCAADDILQLGEVQVVRGSVVPEFVSLPYADELQRCLSRYLELTIHFGGEASSTSKRITIPYNTVMRSTPTAVVTTIQVYGSSWVTPDTITPAPGIAFIRLTIEHSAAFWFVGNSSTLVTGVSESGIIKLEAEL